MSLQSLLKPESEPLAVLDLSFDEFYWNIAVRLEFAVAISAAVATDDGTMLVSSQLMPMQKRVQQILDSG